MYKVIVAGDLLFLNQLRGIFCQYAGHVALTGVSGKQETLAMLKKNIWDLAIFDVDSIGDRDLTLLASATEEKLCQSAVVVDNRFDSDKIRQAFILGASDYLSKPIDSKMLSETIKRCLDESHKTSKVSFMEQAIVTAVSGGDLDAAQRELRIFFDYIADECGGDLVNAGNVILKSSSVIYKGITLNHSWIGKFANDYKLYKGELLLCCDLSSMFRAFEEYILEIASDINDLLNISANKMIRKVCEFTLEHSDERLTLTRIAGNCFVNKTYLSHSFKLETGISFVEYVTQVKIKRAMKYFRESDLRVFEVASLLGFSDTGYFSKKFKKVRGITPNEYKESVG